MTSLLNIWESSLPSAKKYLTNISKAERCYAQFAVRTSLIYKHLTPTICIYCLIALCTRFTWGFDSNSFKYLMRLKMPLAARILWHVVCNEDLLKMNWPKKLSPMSVFFHRHNVQLFISKISKTIENSNSNQVR